MSLPPEELRYQQEHINDNIQPNIYAACFICLPAAFIAVGLRFFARRMTPGGIGKDDIAILFALLFTSGFLVTCIWVTVLGMGKQQILMDPANTVTFIKVTLAAQILYNPAIFFSKLSILFMYHRIFPSKNFTRILWGVGTFILAYSITSSMVNLLQCVPIAANWDPKLAATAKCVNFGAELIALSTINAVTDFVLLVLPMPRLWKLHISMRKKMQLIVIFALGGATVVVSIIRANYVSTISFTNGAWYNAFGAMWSVVETCLAIVSACVPTLKPLYERVFGRSGTTTAGSSHVGFMYPRTGKSDGSGFKMSSFGTGSRDTKMSYPGKSTVSESTYQEEDGRPFARLRDDV